jgi:ClpP class serine protease
MLDAALVDASITGILLDIDSPGGEAGGVFELAQRVRAANAVKPVWAVASDSAFSAAYAIASAASRIYVSQTGGVGSIGVIAMHVDQTARDAQDGYRFTAVTAGARSRGHDARPRCGGRACHRSRSVLRPQRYQRGSGRSAWHHRVSVG